MGGDNTQITYVKNSTAIKIIGYCNCCKILRIKFQPNFGNYDYEKFYDFPRVPANVHSAFLRAPSKGQFYNQKIRDKYSNSRLITQLIKVGNDCKHFNKEGI